MSDSSSDLPRWVFAAVLLILVVGLVAYARGPDHHHGQYVGSLARVHVVQVAR
jgi:hypothetical protein